MGNPYGKILCGENKTPVFTLKNEGPFSSTPHTPSEVLRWMLAKGILLPRSLIMHPRVSSGGKCVGYYALIMRGLCGNLRCRFVLPRDPGLCGEHPHAISNILCTGVDAFFIIMRRRGETNPSSGSRSRQYLTTT